MRKILEIPQLNENDIDKVSKVIDMIANNADKDCGNELNELQSLTGKQHSVEEFAEYWGWTDLHSLAGITLMPEPPCVRDLDRTEIESRKLLQDCTTTIQRTNRSLEDKKMELPLKIALLQIVPCNTLTENLQKGFQACRKAKS